MEKDSLNKIIQDVEAKNRPNGLPVKIIAIDGRGGAGKSTLADKLAKELNAEVLHIDDFASWEDNLGRDTKRTLLKTRLRA
jgi:uridine kinase